MKESFIDACHELTLLHQKVAGVNPALEKRYPVAVVVDETFLIYDVDHQKGNYQFIKKSPIPMPIPEGIQAAFQLEEYDGRIACVVSPDVFDSLAGFVTILHEFVHCFQYETCEQDIKMRMDVARQAVELENFMWEITHPFPYNAKVFIRSYTDFLKAVKNEHHADLIRSRRELRDYLGVHDYEYMVWQEWKEGFARWVENRLQQHLGLPENKGGLNQPYSRVLFYVGGEAFINYLSKANPEVVNDLPALFNKLFKPEA